MRRSEVTGEQVEVISNIETTPMMLSIEGAQCRMYTRDIPVDTLAGHLVGDGYQIIIPAGVSVTLMKVGMGPSYVVISQFGVEP